MVGFVAVSDLITQEWAQYNGFTYECSLREDRLKLQAQGWVDPDGNPVKKGGGRDYRYADPEGKPIKNRKKLREAFSERNLPWFCEPVDKITWDMIKPGERRLIPKEARPAPEFVERIRTEMLQRGACGNADEDGEGEGASEEEDEEVEEEEEEEDEKDEDNVAEGEEDEEGEEDQGEEHLEDAGVGEGNVEAAGEEDNLEVGGEDKGEEAPPEQRTDVGEGMGGDKEDEERPAEKSEPATALEDAQILVPDSLKDLVIERGWAALLIARGPLVENAGWVQGANDYWFRELSVKSSERLVGQTQWAFSPTSSAGKLVDGIGGGGVGLSGLLGGGQTSSTAPGIADKFFPTLPNMGRERGHDFQPFRPTASRSLLSPQTSPPSASQSIQQPPQVNQQPLQPPASQSFQQPFQVPPASQSFQQPPHVNQQPLQPPASRSFQQPPQVNQQPLHPSASQSFQQPFQVNQQPLQPPASQSFQQPFQVNPPFPFDQPQTNQYQQPPPGPPASVRVQQPTQKPPFGLQPQNNQYQHTPQSNPLQPSASTFPFSLQQPPDHYQWTPQSQPVQPSGFQQTFSQGPQQAPRSKPPTPQPPNPSLTQFSPQQWGQHQSQFQPQFQPQHYQQSEPQRLVPVYDASGCVVGMSSVGYQLPGARHGYSNYQGAAPVPGPEVGGNSGNLSASVLDQLVYSVTGKRPFSQMSEL